MEAIIRQIVDRCHVSRHRWDVLRYAISRMKKKYATFRAMSRPRRREFIRQVFAIHAENQQTYREVMSGRF